MSDKLPTDVQAVLDEWSPDAGNDWQIAMWEAFDKVIREQAATIEQLKDELRVSREETRRMGVAAERAIRRGF